MNNHYTASFEDIRPLPIDYQQRKPRERFEAWKQTLTHEQIQEQLDNESGEIVDEINGAAADVAQKTEFVEFIVALQLADFYFPNKQKGVSFDMRRGVDPGTITTFEELVGSFEDYTHVDCLVRSGESEISFQVKRYRGDNTPDAFVEWLNTAVLKHYGKMNGTSLVILLQPVSDGRGPLALDKLYEVFIREALPNGSFDGISLMYNDAESGHMVLHELHPRHHRKLVELNLALARMRGDA